MNRDHRDSDELESLRARIVELEAELASRDAFVIAAAHELRNPISPLFLHVQRLESVARKSTDGTVSSTWLTGQVDVLTQRLHRFLTALNRILDLSSISTGRFELQLEQVDLADITRDVVAGFERELEASGSTLTLDVSDSVVGHWDGVRLEQIVSNLVSNAVRYGDSKPITVRVRLHEGVAELVVIDQGIGIAVADRARIFERFERANTRVRSGFGVGLWMVRQLCEAMNGSVTVESGSGGGSIFRVTLPADRDGSADDR